MPYTTSTVSQIVDRVNRTHFLPAIQRPFVWTPEQILKLYDSLMKGYPISSFLFWDLAPENKNNWEVYKFAENFKFGELHSEIAETDGRDITLVLDGQQRLTSLVLGLRGTYTSKAKNKRWEDKDAWQRKRLFIDLLIDPFEGEVDSDQEDTERSYGFAFHEKQPVSGHGKLWLKVGEVLNFPSEDGFDRFKESVIDGLPETASRGDERTVRRNLDRLYRMVWKDEIVSIFTERDQDYDRVLGIFVRANDAGTKLSKSDLMLSIVSSKWKDISAREEIYSFVEMLNTRLDRKNSITKDFVMKSCLMLSDLDHKYQINNFSNRNLEIMRLNWSETKSALKRTIVLVNRLGIDRDNLTSLNALMPIAYYLKKIGEDICDGSTPFHAANMERIRQWVMASLLNNAFGGTSDRTLGTAKRTIAEHLYHSRDFPLSALTEALSRQLRRNVAFTDDTIDAMLATKYGSKTAFFVLSLLYDDKNWGAIPYQIDHIFPRSKVNRNALLKANIALSKVEQILDASERVGNLQLISARDNQSKNGGAFDAWVTSRDDDFVSRHLIPRNPELWDVYMLPEFVSEREKLIRRRLLTLKSKPNENIANTSEWVAQ